MNDRTKKLLVSAVSFVAIWNVAKLVIQQLIMHETYQFSVFDLVIPLVVSLVIDALASRSRGQ